MHCTQCRKEINKCSEPYEIWGCDGDFIHIACIPAAHKEMDFIADCSDEEFYNWMGVPYET